MVRSVAKSPRSLLKDRAYDEIKRQIQELVLPAGSFLSERKLSTMLGMSKTPIKAALERLEQEGFVVVAPQQGIVVRQLSIKEIADQFELRKALECFVLQSITGRLLDHQTKELYRNLKFQRAAADSHAVARLCALDAEFHLLLCQVLDNRAINECLSQHRSRMHRVIFEVMSQAPGRLSDAVQEHERILEAVDRGKPAEAVKLITQHLEFGKQYLLASKWS
jgi:DNA-binding GntR family transcriptional regulator